MWIQRWINTTHQIKSKCRFSVAMIRTKTFPDKETLSGVWKVVMNKQKAAFGSWMMGALRWPEALTDNAIQFKDLSSIIIANYTGLTFAASIKSWFVFASNFVKENDHDDGIVNHEKSFKWWCRGQRFQYYNNHKLRMVNIISYITISYVLANIIETRDQQVDLQLLYRD